MTDETASSGVMRVAVLGSRIADDLGGKFHRWHNGER